KIQERAYVELKERRFHATEVGMMVTDLLVEHFPKVMDLKFTSHMEEEFDLIESRKAKRDDVLMEFYEPFSQALQVAETKMQTVRGAETDEKCPLCGKALVVRYSQVGRFLGCAGYPECQYIKPRAGRAWPAPPTPSAATPSMSTPKATRSSRSRPASPARSAARRWSSSAAAAGRSWAAAPTRNAAAPSRCRRS